MKKYFLYIFLILFFVGCDSMLSNSSDYPKNIPLRKKAFNMNSAENKVSNFVQNNTNCTKTLPNRNDATVIGSAKMQQDGSIELNLFAVAPGGGVGQSFEVIKPTDPGYNEVVTKLCDIKVGEEKTVYDDIF